MPYFNLLQFRARSTSHMSPLLRNCSSSTQDPLGKICCLQCQEWQRISLRISGFQRRLRRIKEAQSSPVVVVVVPISLKVSPAFALEVELELSNARFCLPPLFLSCRFSPSQTGCFRQPCFVFCTILELVKSFYPTSFRE